MLYAPCSSKQNEFCAPSTVAKPKENVVSLHHSQLGAITATSTVSVKISRSFQIEQCRFFWRVQRVALNLHLLYGVWGRNVYSLFYPNVDICFVFCQAFHCFVVAFKARSMLMVNTDKSCFFSVLLSLSCTCICRLSLVYRLRS